MFELHLRVPQAEVEAVGDALQALDALSVSVEDADAHTDAEVALYGEPGTPLGTAGWNRSRVVALFATQNLAQEAAALLQAQDFFAGSEITGLVPLIEQDWVSLTQSQFAPVEVTADFWIVPTWHNPPAAARRVLRLDPGMAFGTGTHPTTLMCLRWIARHAANWQLHDRLLDYGCGSGVLAMAAALLSPVQVHAVDIDPLAVQATANNAAANSLELVVGLPDTIGSTYRVVVANILATPLKVLAPLLVGRMAAGADLVLAGILERQADELIAHYAQAGCALRVADQLDGWVLLATRG
jgi:ribosomal protein L11 methyltransferase